MPNAIITQSVYVGDGTQSGFLSALSASMLTAGFSLFHSYAVSGNEARVYNCSTGSQTFSNLLLEVGFSAVSTIRLRGFSAFTTANNTGSNVSTAAGTLAITLTSTFNFFAINHAEMRGCLVYQNSIAIGFLGYLKLNVLPGWWDENQSPCAFIPRTIAIPFSPVLQTISALRPTGLGANLLIASHTNATANTANNGRRTVRAAHIDDDSNKYGIGTFSSDLGVSASNSMTLFDTIVTTTEEFAFVDGSPSATVTRLFIKVA
jgi:hypothetical protein